MVLGGEPENRNAFDTLLSGYVRQFDGSEGFENRKQRAAEQSDLLAGDRGGSAVAQATNVLQGLGRRAPSLVLTPKNGSHTLPASGIIVNSCNFVFHPLVEVWGSRIELLHSGVSGKKIGKERCSMRDLAER